MTQNEPKSTEKVSPKIKERREEVKKLYFKSGLTEEETAERLDVSRSTIKRDKKSIREEWHSEFSERSKYIVYEILASFELMRKELARLYYFAEDIMDKVRIAGEKRKLNSDYFDMLEKLGLIATYRNGLVEELNQEIKITWKD